MNGNDLVNPVLDIDSQYKEINDVYFNTLALDSTSFNSSQLAVLNQLAFECPLEGGDAVFRARTLLALITDTIYYDDQLCAGNGSELRSLRVTKNDTAGSIKVRLYPNPARDYAVLQVSEDISPLQLKVIDGTGGTVINTPISTTNGYYTINTSSLTTGIYYVALYGDNGKLFGDKLSIFR